MRKSKFISLLLALAMILGSFAFAFAENEPILISPAPSGDIVILHLNDAHCHNYQDYAKLVTLAKDADLIVDNGDAIQGDVIGTLSKGEYITDIMNYAGIDVAGLGNHEFDYGIDQLKRIAAAADFPYVCCNLVDLRTGEPLFDAYKIFEVKGKKIAVVGICTPETFVKSTPTYFQDEKGNYIYSFSEGNAGQTLYDAVQKAVDAARAEGADYVIANGHLGILDESAPYRAQDVVANTTGIDAFIDGHSHTVYTDTFKSKDGKDVLAEQTGCYLANIGKITIKEDGTITGENVPVESIEAAGDAAAFIATITAKFEDLTNAVVAKTTVDLTTLNEDGSRAVRSKETNLGDFCADAYRAVLGADIGFANGGGIRANLPAGDITFGNLVSVHPFGNMACLVEVTGQQVLDALELSYSQLPGELGGFLQISGITCTVNTAIPTPVVRSDKNEFVKVEGQRRVSDVLVGGKPIDPAATYTVASHNYMLKNGGDGYTMFGAANEKILADEVLIDNQVLINYIVDNLNGVVGSEYATSQGRINIINDPSKVEFSDVKDSDYFAPAVKWAVEKGITAGKSAGKFAPADSCTRAQMVTFLWIAAGKPEAKAAAEFSDVPKDAYYAKAVAWAVEKGITSGIGNGKFGSDVIVSRGQAMTLLYGAMGAPAVSGESSFDDVAAADYFNFPVIWASGKGITAGKSASSFAPADPCTRGQIVTFLYNAYK